MFTSKLSSVLLLAGMAVCLVSCDPQNRNSNDDTIMEDSTSQLDRRIDESDRNIKNPTVEAEQRGLVWEEVEIPAAVRQSIERNNTLQGKEINKTMSSVQGEKTLYLITFKSDTTRYVFDEQGQLQPDMDIRDNQINR